MQFNSLEYLFFFIIVFFVFWFLLRDNLKLQNIFLLIANYVFYGWWDWRFLFLIILISGVNYYASIRIDKIDPDIPGQKRKFFLLFALVTNLGLLGIFKYFNFFAQSTVDLLNTFGFRADAVTLNIILPIGISFYTFQTMSYTLDVYRTKIEPTKDIISFFAYVSFFPLLLAGPIERADNLLVQFFKKKEFNYDEATDGMRQILWGFFKKLVIADNCAILVNEIFNKYESQPSSVLIMGTIYFAFQVYGDFSGYSDIAIGSAKLLGFKLMTNFKTPFFSRDIAEFWRRWHISLSSWLRDYLFMPLSLQLRNLKIWGGIISVVITFLLCGFWHGANWTFILWGGLNGIYFIPLILLGQTGKNLDTVADGKYFPNLKELVQMGVTFGLTCVGLVFFRAENLSEAFKYVGGVFSHEFLPQSLFSTPEFQNKSLLFFILLLLIIEWINRDKEHSLKINNVIIPKVFRIGIYLIFVYIILVYGNFNKTEFIYFAF